MASEDRSNRVFPHISAENGFRMEFGDSRGDVHPAFTLLNTAFLRLHNILADKLAELHPGWSKDKLYLEARKINAAIAQHITYTQFMDAILGTPNAVRTDDRVLHKDYYRPSVDPRISMIFSTAAFRLHTYVSGRFELRDHRYRPTRSLKLRDIFHDPLQLLANNTYDELTRGLAAQSVHDFNNVYTSEMTEWLFAEKDKDFGFDIVSLNVQRGRDHQIQGYTNYKWVSSNGNIGCCITIFLAKCTKLLSSIHLQKFCCKNSHEEKTIKKANSIFHAKISIYYQLFFVEERTKLHFHFNWF